MKNKNGGGRGGKAGGGSGKAFFLKNPQGGAQLRISQFDPQASDGGGHGFAAGGVASRTAGPFNDLVEWVEARGGKADGVEVGEVAPGLRGTRATRAFRKGELVFSIPHDACILDEGLAEVSPVAEVWKLHSSTLPRRRTSSPCPRTARWPSSSSTRTPSSSSSSSSSSS